MGQQCSAPTQKQKINTHRRRPTNGYRMMLDDEEILQSPSITLISPMSTISQSPSPETIVPDNTIYEQIQDKINTEIYSDRETSPLAFTVKQLTISPMATPSISWDYKATSPQHIDMDYYADNDDDDPKISLISIRKLMDDDMKNNMIKGKDGKMRSKPNLWRPDTTAPWEEFSDIEELEDEMRIQLAKLTDDHDNLHLDIGKCRRSSITNLLRDESADKWDEEEIEETINDMQKELKHLMKNELNSVSA
mmetsp:Transcript_57782/g.52060  ORF Transcript_57782/g.52060 Transcript_57782/m.52060 type:complete len:250 (+) Transcript_57782:33-782(+)